MLDISTITYELKKDEKTNQILLCNEVTSRYGLILKEEDIEQIIETQQIALYDVGRLELEGTIIEQMIIAFCDSVFITKYEYVQTVTRLVEIFYYYKADLDEEMTDEDIIEYLKRSFEGPCQGSLDWLEDNQFNALLRALNDRRDIYEDYEYGCF